MSKAMRGIARISSTACGAAVFVAMVAQAGASFSASNGVDRLRDPVAACRGAGGSAGTLGAAVALRKSDGTIVVKNVSSGCISQVLLTDGDQRYRIGRLTPEQLVSDILEGSATGQISQIETIWRWTSNAFLHYCSQGSPFRAWWHRSGSLLSRIYSNSFGCCSDVNDPILGSLLEVAGFPAWIFYSPVHVAIQAGDEENGAAYVDADHKVLIPGSLFTQDHSAYPASYFMDYLHYSDVYTDEEVAADPGLVLRRSGVVDPQPMTLILANGDSLWFTNEPLGSLTVAFPPVSPDDSIGLERTRDTKFGIADLDLRSFFHGIDESTPERCAQFDIEFPYALIDSGLVNVPRRASVFLVDDGGMIRAVEDAPLNPRLNRPGRAASSRTLATTDYDTWGDFQLHVRVCNVPVRSLRRTRLRLLFQYNGRIFPSERDAVTIEAVSVPSPG